MKRILAGLIILSAAAAAAVFLEQAVFASEGADCSIAARAIEIASRLRRLRILHAVPCRLQDRREVESYLREAVKKKMSEERITYEGEVYRLLGFVPKDYDYLNGLIELYTDQLGGYYDPERKYYAMANWMPAAMQMPIAIHELTHALEDQHFNLEKITSTEQQTSDALLARSALLEGNATAVMLDYARELSGQPSVAEEPSVSTFMFQNISGAMISQSLRKAPPALQATLIFPYVSGLNFTHIMLRKGGFKRVDQSFARLPDSTEEILHPDKYATGKRDFVELEAEQPPPELELKSAQPAFSDRLGEFFVSTLLGTWLRPREASAAASGWGGDRVALYQLADSEKHLLFWVIAWDDRAQAVEFFQALTEAYGRRFQSKPEQQSDENVQFTTEDFGKVELKLEQKKTLLSVGG